MPIIVEASEYSDKDLESAVNEDIDRFERYFQGLGNDPLMGFEKAILKTFLWWKTHGEPSSEQAAVHGKTHGESDAEKATG